MSFTQTFMPDMFFEFADVIPAFVWNTIVICQLLFVPCTLLFEGRLNWKVIKGYIPYYFYSFTWFPISVVGIFKKNNKEWFHTQHTRTISLAEIEK